MKANSERVTAKIYQFPFKGLRQTKDFQRHSSEKEFVADFSDAAFGGAWYHEEAIRDSDKAPKRD
jgi:hypothetical protein